MILQFNLGLFSEKVVVSTIYSAMKQEILEEL